MSLKNNIARYSTITIALLSLVVVGRVGYATFVDSMPAQSDLSAAVADASSVSSSTNATVQILSQTSSETWYKLFNEAVITRATNPVDLFLVASPDSTSGYYLGRYPSKTSKISGSGTSTVTSTNFIPFAATFFIPKGSFYVKAVVSTDGVPLKLFGALPKTATIPSGASALSASTINVIMPPPYIVVTNPTTDQVWKKKSLHTVTWVADFKRSDSMNTSYAAIALTMPYGIKSSVSTTATGTPGIITTTSGASNCTSMTSAANSLPGASALSDIPKPPTPLGNVKVTTVCNPISSSLPGLDIPNISIPGIPSIADLPGLPVYLPNPLKDLFGVDSKPFAVPVTVKAVAYTGTSTNRYGASYPLTVGDVYLEQSKVSVTPFRLQPGKYVIVVSTKLVNVKTKKIDTISGTSSVITITD